MSTILDQHNHVSPAPEVAREEASHKNIVTLAEGVRAKLHPVSARLISEVTSRVKYPSPPTWHNPDKDREEPNESDPDYLNALAETEQQRGMAAMDALVMFGVELIDPVPEDGKWLKQLRLMEKRDMIDLSGYDLEDPLDLEFLFKRLVAVDTATITRVGNLSGVTEEGVTDKESQFQGHA